MTIDFLPFPLLVGLALLVVLLLILRRRKSSLPYLFFFSLFWIYLLLVASQTLFPIPIRDAAFGPLTKQNALYMLSRVNLVFFNYNPYRNIDPAYIFIREIVANILLTMPFGFLLPFIARLKTWKIPLLAVAAGVGIETAQLALCLLVGLYYRGVDINDALMNAIGVLLGYALFRFFSCWQFLLVTRRFTREHKGLLGYVHAVANRK